MQDEAKLNRILAQLDDIRREVKSMMPQPKPIVQPCEYEPSAIDRFWEKVEDWLFVRGSFAPKGVTHEFAVAGAMAFVVVTGESYLFGRDYLAFLRGGFVTIVWAVVASMLLATGIVRRIRLARLVGLGVLAASVAKLLLFDTSSLATPGRVGVFAAVGVLLIAGAFLYLKFKSRFEE